MLEDIRPLTRRRGRLCLAHELGIVKYIISEWGMLNRRYNARGALLTNADPVLVDLMVVHTLPPAAAELSKAQGLFAERVNGWVTRTEKIQQFKVIPCIALQPEDREHAWVSDCSSISLTRRTYLTTP